MGLSYSVSLEKEENKEPLDELIEENGIKFIVPTSSVMYLLGTTIDFKEDLLSSEFVFDNPNSKV